MNHDYTVLERFLRYVQIDTQSDPHSQTVPSTEKQKNLSRLLVEELKELGINHAEMDDKGYVYATIPSNSNKNIPAICFCSHVDTSPESSGKDVKPIVHRGYDGSIIKLPNNPDVVLDPNEHPELKTKIADDIVTADGTTLLGADNKAGVAEIMDMATYFMKNPSVKHGPIKILFTPDEEIGRGADHVSIEKLGARYGYTVDGEALGSFEDETFSADMVEITIQGVNTHPGFAKNKMESALKAASEFIAMLPSDDWSPETTSDRTGFVHPYEMNGGVEKMKLTFIIRSFDDRDLEVFESRLKALFKKAMARFPNSKYTFTVSEQYRNMKNVIQECPQVSEFAVEAIERAGLKVKKGSIRGGTDGSKLSFMGLPCPNIFAGEHAFHSKMEWASVQDMQKAVNTLVHLVQIWEEKGEE